jgi:hypothetical protein
MQALQSQLQGQAVQDMFHHLSQTAELNSRSPPSRSYDAPTKINISHESSTVRANQLQMIEAQLFQLNKERDKCKDELSKMPQHVKKAEQIRRRDWMEQEVSNLTKKIGLLK